MRRFLSLKTYVKNIRFEGCWVGEGPTRMATFGKLFDAQRVSAFNWTCNTSDVATTIPGVSGSDQRREELTMP
jgi:hypothetical protein